MIGREEERKKKKHTTINKSPVVRTTKRDNPWPLPHEQRCGRWGSYQILSFAKFIENWIPLFSVDATSFIFIKAVTGASSMEFDAEALHVVEFHRCLSLWSAVDFHDYLYVLFPINLLFAGLFMGRETRFGPFTTTDIPLMFVQSRINRATRLTNVGVVFVLFASTPCFIDDLLWR